MHIPMHAGFLSFIQSCHLLNYCQIFCTTYSLLLVYFLNSLFRCFLVLHQFYFSSCPFCFGINHCSLICAKLSHLIHCCFLLLFFLVCLIQYMVLTIVVDYVLTLKVLFLVLMVVSSEVVSFHNESHIFLSQTSQKK